MVTIRDVTHEDDRIIEQMAQMLVEGFREHWSDAWPTLEEALNEVREMLVEDRICRVALDEGGEAVGWIGGIEEYDGMVWELHPMVVRTDMQKRGIGWQLVRDLEAEVAKRGALTLQLGTDDQDSMTTLADTDLYDDLPSKIANIRNLRGHPYEFYQKLGFKIVGVVPDANGIGKPDILMAKRIQPPSA